MDKDDKVMSFIYVLFKCDHKVIVCYGGTMLSELLFLDILALDYFINKQLKERNLNSFQLMLGYRDYKVIRIPVVVNMRKTPHVLVCGLSNCGKSKMIEYAVKDKRCVLINVFPQDFRNILAPRIVGNAYILDYFNSLLKNIKNNKEPLYLVVDEMLVLCMNKAITKAILDILAVGRHYNVFLVGITQNATKENLKFKDLFNVRVCFRQVEQSSYNVVLGYTPEKKIKKQRQFYLYADYIARGSTYSINS